MTNSAYESARDAAVAARDATIPSKYLIHGQIPTNAVSLLKTSGLLSTAELAILDLSATALAATIARKDVSCVQVTTAYVKAASLAQQGTNCLVELFANEALAQATALDQELAVKGPRGPLHGVPVSIKDHVDVRGHDSPSGFLSRVGKCVATEDAHMVSVMRDAGAVFYCKTTNPQALMQLECTSYLGTTTNPHNTRLTPGGSSGGEGALIGFKGSPLGIGTDVGGSIRCPAAHCGIYGFKPTAGRVPYGGCNAPMLPPGWEGILCTHGPMARSAEDLEMYMKLIADSEPWRRDPSLVVKPWTPVRSAKLRVGVLWDDGVVAPVVPMRRGLEMTVDKLRAAGHEVVTYKPYKSEEAWEVLRKLYWPDAGQAVRQCLDEAGEPMHPLSAWIIDQGGEKAPTASDLLSAVAARDAFRLALAKHWQESGVDVVLSPAYATPAPPHFTSTYWNYTAYWNLANYPAAVFPTGLVVESGDVHEGSPRNDKEKEIWDTYDPATAEGAPISLQLVGYVGQDEATLAALRVVIAAME
ncbi:amidase [Cutaneotrichosporon oleaginosum]|uniref:amidase n=1 Tax=Cutaneotrichosporon oleaginosum TaxID=879819 RepID=A0A0J0XPC2_9TREE|nr:amidase [Cutaneotrichosporon oleaginosum]KLT42912.1 amidase [Cutaneotrichosporon oleaginosum]TXT12615.1 hypothetical protein COLE_03025 [Cutaneotrichosporon oleaginosum]